MKTFGPFEIALFLVVAGLLFGYGRRLLEMFEQINRGGPGGPAATPAADPFTYFRRWGRRPKQEIL